MIVFFIYFPECSGLIGIYCSPFLITGGTAKTEIAAPGGLFDGTPLKDIRQCKMPCGFKYNGSTESLVFSDANDLNS